MKKTYFAPELESVKIASVRMMAASKRFNVSTDNSTENSVNSEGGVWSKGYSGGLWDEGNEE